ncbi:MAG: hypothetical protein R6U20_01870, partial [Longimonas sp.]|uniref:hypothetical protein n=1 Tax=Longimonas sp. TaxID=2039626 RepID=UPI003976B4AE
FYTGDIGNLDDEGFLKITDRKKEMFKTSGGKYIAPQVIENKLKESPPDAGVRKGKCLREKRLRRAVV